MRFAECGHEKPTWGCQSCLKAVQGLDYRGGRALWESMERLSNEREDMLDAALEYTEHVEPPSECVEGE